MLFRSYHWPGNVRELINTVEYAFVLCHEGKILAEHLPAQLRMAQPHVSVGGAPQAAPQAAPRAVPGKNGPDKAPGREELCRALNQARGKKREAARLLGVSRVTLWKWLKNHNLNVEDIVGAQ